MEIITPDEAPPRPSPPSTSDRATTTTTSSSSYLPPGSASASSFAGSGPAPSGHAFRRSMTLDEAAQFRRRPSPASFPLHDTEAPAMGLRRRGSSLSDFSISDTRRTLRSSTEDILNPTGEKHEAQENSSVLSNLPLIFALLPALCGVLFEGGSQVITDVMLLGLVFIFLRYTVTQPWQWYHSAQELRIREEVGLEQVFEDESDEEVPTKMTAPIARLDDVPEEPSQDGEGTAETTRPGPEQTKQGRKLSEEEKPSRTRLQVAAVNELYIHEILALVSCFSGPVLGAYLLHAIRAQLSRPSEGQLSDFNITVFLLAAELRPLSHALKLIQARTLHLQRIVQSTPIARSTVAQLEEMRAQLAQLELRADATEEATAATQQKQQQQNGGAGSSKKEAALVREVRNAIQPELDALNRAVRRYEKKATVLSLQTESRLGAVDTRLNDAIALAAAAVKQRNGSQWSTASPIGWILNTVLLVVTAPFFALMYIIMWPFSTVAALFPRKASRSSREGRAGGRSGQSFGGKGLGKGSGLGSDKDRHRDRVPSRLSRRYSP